MRYQSFGPASDHVWAMLARVRLVSPSDRTALALAQRRQPRLLGEAIGPIGDPITDAINLAVFIADQESKRHYAEAKGYEGAGGWLDLSARDYEIVVDSSSAITMAVIAVARRDRIDPESYAQATAPWRSVLGRPDGGPRPTAE